MFNTISDGRHLEPLQLSPKTVLCEEGGGTIASVASPEGKIPHLSLREILERALPDHSELANLILPKRGPVLGSLIASPNYIHDYYAIFADAILAGLKDDRIEGILLTLGTDTLSFVAAALSEVFPTLNKPVVLTGAQRSLDDSDSDIPRNLRTSLLALRFLNPGIYVVFGGVVIEGHVVSKISSRRTDACAAINSEPVALFNGDTAFVNTSKKSRYAVACPDAIDTRFDPMIRVETLFPGYSPQNLESILRSGATHGVILRTYGLGNPPVRGERSILPVLQTWAKKKPIVDVSQCIDGGTDLRKYETGKKGLEAGLLESRTLTFELATVRLMRLLAQTTGRDELKAKWDALL